jgi:hypothetical protein
MKTCGDFGGRRKDGEPCQRPSREGTCRDHLGADSSDSIRRSLQLEAQNRFLEALPRTRCNLTLAAQSSGISRSTHYDWMDQDPTYPARFHEALEVSKDYLRAEIHRRGVVGVEEPWKVVENVDQEGNRTREILHRRRYSDRLLLRLAEAHLPEFRRRLDVRLIERELDGMTDEELVAETERLVALARSESVG